LEENARLRKELENSQSGQAVGETNILDKSPRVITSISSTPSGSNGHASFEQPGAKVLRRSNRNYYGLAATEIITSAEAHGTQFHGPTSAMFDGEQPVEGNKVDSTEITIASQKTRLLAEAARQRTA